MTTVIVCGPRNRYSRRLAERVVGRLRARHGDALVVRHGAASGIDQSFEDAAAKLGMKTEPYPGDWKKHGNGAGPIRNRAMIGAGADFVIARRRGPEWTPGTLDCARQALAAGLAVYLVEGEDGEPRRLRDID